MSNELEKLICKSSLLKEYANEIVDEQDFRRDCKTCNSALRKEIESKFESTKSYTAAHKFSVEKGEKIDYHALRRHLLNHYQAQSVKMLIKEYSGKIDMIMKQKYNKKQQILERLAILQNKLYTLEATAEGSDLKETISSADALKKLCEAISNTEKELDLVDKEMNPVFLLVQNFTTIIKEEMKATEDENIKIVLERVFDKLTESTKDINLQG